MSPGLLPPGTYCAPLLQIGKDAPAFCAWRWRARALAAARRRWSSTRSSSPRSPHDMLPTANSPASTRRDVDLLPWRGTTG
jgi:hypothetical protein